MRNFLVSQHNLLTPVRYPNSTILLEEIEQLAVHELKAETFLVAIPLINRLSIVDNITLAIGSYGKSVSFFALFILTTRHFQKPMFLIIPQSPYRIDRTDIAKNLRKDCFLLPDQSYSHLVSRITFNIVFLGLQSFIIDKHFIVRANRVFAFPCVMLENFLIRSLNRLKEWLCHITSRFSLEEMFLNAQAKRKRSSRFPG